MIRALQMVGLFSAIPLVPLAILVWGWNPWFLDSPDSFGLFVVLPAAGLGLGLAFLRVNAPGEWIGLLCAACAAALALLRPLPGPAGTTLLIVGIDGATWDVANGLSLPHLEQVRTQGKSGVLMAERPLFSPLLWTTMATGKRPDDHGIHGFRVRADQATAARFWEIARASGQTVGLYKWLVTWPPPQADESGFVVPAWLAPDAATHPPSLSWVKELELSRRVHRKRVETRRAVWQIGLDGVLGGLRFSTVFATLRYLGHNLIAPLPEQKRTSFLRRLRIRIDRDLFVAQLHAHRPDLATFTMYATDALGHTHWGLSKNEVIHSAYRLSDQILGEIQQEAGPQVTVMVVSDHGFRAAQPEDRERRRLPTTAALEGRIQAEVGPVEVARVGHKLTLTWIGEEPEVGRERLVAWLQEFKVDATGQPLFRWEEIPERTRALGLTLSDAAFDPAAIEFSTVSGAQLADFVRLAPGQAGEHDARGIVALAGPGVAAGDLGEVSQLDLAPTVLALLGLPSATDMPGRSWVPESGARVPTYDALAPARTERTVPAAVDETQLRALGYVE